MKTTKTQFLGKRLLIPLLLVEIAAIGAGLSFSASSATLKTFQSTESAAKSQLISKKVAEHKLASLMDPIKKLQCKLKPSLCKRK